MIACWAGWEVLLSEVTLNAAVVPHKSPEAAKLPVGSSS